MHAHEGAAGGGVQHRAVHIVPVGVGAVEDDKGDSLFGAGFHHIVQRGDIGIEAAADILKVEEHAIHILQLLRRGLLVLAVEADDGQTRLGVSAVVHLGARRRGAAEAVFRTEYLGDVHTRAEQGIHKVCCPHHRGLVCHHRSATLIAALAEQEHRGEHLMAPQVLGTCGKSGIWRKGFIPEILIALGMACTACCQSQQDK